MAEPSPEFLALVDWVTALVDKSLADHEAYCHQGDDDRAYRMRRHCMDAYDRLLKLASK